VRRSFVLPLFCAFFAGLAGAAYAVDVSTATGQQISFDSLTNSAVIEGDAQVETSTGIMKADKITINTISKEGHAEGHFELLQDSGTLRGSEAHYNWQTSTGIVSNAEGSSLDWHFSGDKMIQTSPNVFTLRNGIVTSCDEDPPHYYLRSTRTKIVTGERMKMVNTRLAVGDTPIFYSPFFTKSLKPKKYKLRIEPGHSSRDGLITDTTLGYPFTTNTYTTFRWRFKERTGNDAGVDHSYFRPDLNGTLNYSYIRDYNPDPQPQHKETRIAWNHYNTFSKLRQLTMRVRANYTSSQDFGNQFGASGRDVRVESKEIGLLSEGELAYQFPKALLSTHFDRKDKFDNTVSSSSFISKLTLPRVSLATTELTFKNVPFKTNFTANYINETNERSDPKIALRYKQTVDTGVTIKREFLIKKRTTLTPSVGYRQTWSDRLVSTGTDTKDYYVGRYNTGFNVRERLTRSVDLNLNHSYIVRFKPNQTIVETEAVDRGVEANQLNASVNSRVGRNTSLILTSGYNLQSNPRTDTSLYKNELARVTPPQASLQWEPIRDVMFDYSETYSVYDGSLRKEVYRPLNTSGGVQVGSVTSLVSFSHRFSYSKTPANTPAEVIFNDRLKFFLTPK
jgi:lipopolysaccharide assembly outer membrane protein LptD (OstA)